MIKVIIKSACLIKTNTFYSTLTAMSANTSETAVVQPTQKVAKAKKLKPARKQVNPGDVVKTETPQTGKEYSKPSLYLSLSSSPRSTTFLDIWYNKWAGGDREDNYSKYVVLFFVICMIN
jgi:hypothetical protein